MVRYVGVEKELIWRYSRVYLHYYQSFQFHVDCGVLAVGSWIAKGRGEP